MIAAPERKLTTIVAADVAGYSAMMGRDEPGTLAQLKSSRETMADERFSSVVNAVECAVRVQRALAERNATLPDERRMRFRIGINLGDVMVEGDDLFGEGVNIAARLEALAEPGGILISGAVFDQVRSKLALGFDFLGAQAVKNISEPVPAWRVVLDGERGASFSHREKAPRGLDEEVLHASDGRRPTGAASPPSPSATPSAHGRGEATPWQRLRRPATFAAVLIAFFFLINVSTSTEELWFRWPALVILFVLGLRAAWIMGR